ncbi:MAG: T9SS type A sorting domain-containing protein [Chitinophagaceae bacterium]|nr:T9SS type A sorting domain-containing protein [Chitinophagaceae bacterium]
MKKITLSVLLLCTAMLGLFSAANAQVRRSSFRVDAPASIQGYKIIEEIDSTSTTSPWGTSIDSTWEGFPVAYDPTNLDGCGTGTPAGYYNGKFALVFRGGCEFGLKALNAQNAGARGVIIVNNLMGVAGMGAGASGANVEIPVVMVTTADGNAMKAQIDAGNPVTVSLTAWRFDSVANPVDIGFMNDGPILPIGKCIPVHQTSTLMGNSDENYRVYGGSVFYNFSTANWDTLFQAAYISNKTPWIGGTYTLQDSNKINWNFSTPVTTLDSLLAVAIDTINGNLVGFDMNDATKGMYKVENYMSTIPNTEVGLAPLNNEWTYEYAIHDSIYSKAAYDFSKNSPVANSYVNVSGVAEWGPILYIRNGGYAAKKVQVVVMRDVIDDSTFAGQDVLVTLSKWSDNDGNGAIDYSTELDEVGSASYQMQATDIVPIAGMTLTMNLNNTVTPGQLIKLEAGSKYWLRVTVPGGTDGYAIGTDYYSDYRANLNFDISEGNPLYFNSTMYGGGFSNAGSPSIALHMGTNAAESVEDINAFAGTVSVYPNPATDKVNVNLNLDKMSSKVTYTIVDVTGKTIATETKSNVTSDIFSYNTSKLSAGSYFVNIVTETGNTQVKFTVAK